MSFNASKLFQKREHMGEVGMGVKSEEQVFSGLAHLAIRLSIFGPIVTIALYVWQKEKSPFVARHALQAFGWQIAGLVVGLAVELLLIGSIGVSLLNKEFFPTTKTMLSFMGGFAIVMLVYLVFLIVAVIAAIKGFTGQAYTYPLIGSWVESLAGGGKEEK